MSLKWIKTRKLLVAVGIIVIGWATLQTESESLASGNFLTDRIGEGSVLHARRMIQPELDGRIVYFQEGRPVALTQLRADEPYCRFTSAGEKLGTRLRQKGSLVVQFRNVARAHWFFGHGIQLDCAGTHDGASIRESEFQQTLGSYFQVEKHTDRLAGAV